MPAAQQSRLGTVRHEHFCLPRPELEEPRIEGFVSYEDGSDGKSRPAAFVTRCVECGATTYKPLEG